MTSFEIVKEYTLRLLVIFEDAWLQRIEGAERLEASSDFYLIEVAFARDRCKEACLVLALYAHLDFAHLRGASMAGAIMELLQQMRDAIQEGPGSKARDIFKPVPKWYVENFCGQGVAEKVISICRALQSLPDKLDQVQDAQSQGDALKEARGNLKTEIETGSTRMSADQIKGLQDGVPRYMLRDKCLPDILKWNGLPDPRYLLFDSTQREAICERPIVWTEQHA
jgi:hypothetical protein